AVGVQRDSQMYREYACDTTGLTPGLQVSFALQACGTPTPTLTPCPLCPTNTPTDTYTATSTRTPTNTRTVTRTRTPTVCAGSYAYATGSGDIVPGTVDTGNHCDDCVTAIQLPFAFQLYDQSFS